MPPMAKGKQQAAYNMVISWSGDRSKKVARAFRQWLPTVLHSAKPWISQTDLEKGTIWQGELGDQLEACRVGIVFLTRENLSAPWLHFEAGALCKPNRKGRIFTVLLGDLTPDELNGLPLAMFQHTSPIKDEIEQMVINIASTIEADVSTEILSESFNNGWQKIEEALVLESVGEEVRPETPRASPATDEFFRLITSPNLSPEWRRRINEYVELRTELNREQAKLDASLNRTRIDLSEDERDTLKAIMEAIERHFEGGDDVFETHLEPTHRQVFRDAVPRSIAAAGWKPTLSGLVLRVCRPD